MDDTKIIAFDTTQPIWSEMERQLPRMADMLGVRKDDLKVMDYDWFPQEYMTSKFRDKVVDVTGVLPGLPFIQKRRLQSSGSTGYGIFLFENYLDPTIKYILYTVKSGDGWDVTYLIIPEGKLYQLKRNAVTLNKLASHKLNPPVLEEGLLEDVVQNTVGFLLRAKDIEKYGVKIKRGIILDGAPGNGKTMLCRYIQKLCSQNSIRWGTVTSADIDQAYADKELNQLFSRWPVTFFDDIDVGYMDRSKGNGKMACSLLTAMDGMYDAGHLVRVFTTNEEVKDLDRAFTRPGRIDKFITIKSPTPEMIKRLLLTWPQEIQDNINIDTAVERSKEFSFAEVEAIRTFLVGNKILGDGTWDLDGAFEEFNERREEDNHRRGVGFGDDKSKRKKKKKRSNKTGRAIVEKGGKQKLPKPVASLEDIMSGEGITYPKGGTPPAQQTNP